jgi:hypothetical protein
MFNDAVLAFGGPLRGKSLPTSLSLASVEDYVNVGILGKTLFQRCVHEGITTRDDE